MSDDSDWYWVTGINPEPWTPGTVNRHGKYAHMVKDEKLRVYQEALAEEFVYQNPHYLLRSGHLSLTFYFWRSSAHGNQADATNLQKATEDALQKILYVNDKNNWNVQSWIVEQEPTTSPHLLIVVKPYEKPSIQPPAGVIVPKYADTDWTPPDEELF